MPRFQSTALAVLVLTGSAHASSFADLSDVTVAQSSSILVIGDVVSRSIEVHTGNPQAEELAATGIMIMLSRSVIAVGVDALPPSREAVAAVDTDNVRPAWNPDSLPMVIRGGIVGDAFAPARRADSVETPTEHISPMAARRQARRERDAGPAPLADPAPRTMPPPGPPTHAGPLPM